MVLLEEIKKRLSIPGEYHDGLLLGLAEDVKHYMLSSGVKQSVIESEKSIGCISRGVLDLWTKENYSELFLQRVIQLSFEPEYVSTESNEDLGGDENVQDNTGI